MRLQKSFFSAAVLLLSAVSLFGQAHDSIQAHSESVNEIAALETTVYSEDNFISAGKDGYLIKWNSGDEGEFYGQHYQITDLQIKLITRSPKNNEIAVYETDGVSVHRVSVWDWKNLKRKYAKRFNDTVTALSYSEKGNYLMIGTSSMNGVYILNASSGSVVKKPSNAPSHVTLIKTGDSEKNIIMYSQTGSIVYYNLRSNKQTAKFNTETRLEQLTIFGSEDTKNRFLAGYKDNMVYIIDALSGKNINLYPARQALLCTSHSEYEKGIYFTAFDSKEYTLNLVTNEDLKSMIINESSKTFKKPASQIIKKFIGPKGKDYITCASKNSNMIFLGSQTGNLYYMDAVPESEKRTLFPITEKTYEKIYDVVSDDDYFYFLTDNSIFRTSYETESVEKIASNLRQTNMIKYLNGAVLWSKDSSKNVDFVVFSENNIRSPETLFTTSNSIQAAKIFSDKLIYIEGNSSVNIYDFITKQITNVFTGTALQDAVIYDEKYVYVAKTSAVEPKTILLQINMETGEILPVKMSGTILYSLSYDETKKDSPIYGVSIANENNSSLTKVISYTPSNNRISTILKLSDEDSVAFTSLNYPWLFTNIGKTSVRSYNITARKNTQYKRSASLPVKASSNTNILAVLNSDGSISWYKKGYSNLLSDWYLTVDGQWKIF